MGRWERWLLPGILALVGLPFLIVGGAVWRLVPQSMANHAEEVARLPVATASTLNERGTRVLIEGRVGDRMALSDRPPLVAYNEYRWVKKTATIGNGSFSAVTAPPSGCKSLGER
jgi:hypothetical protein